MTIAAQKCTLLQKINEGDILMGELIAPVTFKKFVVNKATKVITETEIIIPGRQISISEIRKELLGEHEKLGIVRVSQHSLLSDGELNEALHVRHVTYDSNATVAEKQQLLQACQQQRYLKIWHDHGPIAGRGHFMVLVACIYDPAFYYTPLELANKGISIDVISTVEKPQLHILAQSGSSDTEQ